MLFFLFVERDIQPIFASEKFKYCVKMNLLLKHHLISGWRNILKYKVQNIISVLCLAVGTAVFAVVLWLSISIWNEFYYREIAYNNFDVTIYSADSVFHSVIQDRENIARLQELNCVEKVSYISYNSNILFAMTQAKGDTLCKQSFSYTIVSPDWLESHHFKSATTGKRFGKLKNGTVLMQESSYKKYYSSYIKNPVGSKILNSVHPMKIDDMIDTDWSVGDYSDLLIVSDLKEKELFYPDSTLPENNLAYSISVTLKDGYNYQQFDVEAAKKMPDCRCEYHLHSDQTANASFILFCVCLFLGMSVLIIGLSGYLKMQVQLYYLRNREMALRRCNGAKPQQLFMLLAAEMFITFTIVLLLAAALTMALSEYLMPKIEIEFHRFYLPIDLIFTIEGYIALITFIISVLILWVSSRKVIRMPLNLTAGKSYVAKTKWRSALQETQYVVVTILLFFVFLASIFLYFNYHKIYPESSIDQYKEAVILYPDDEAIDKLPSVKHVSRLVRANSVCAIDPEDMKLLGAKVVGAKDYPMIDALGDTIKMCPVFAKRNEAAQVCRQLGLPLQKVQAKIHPLDNDYMPIGYASGLDIDKGNNSYMYYLVRPKMTYKLRNEMYQQGVKEGWGEYTSLTFVFPKSGQGDAMYRSLQKIVKKSGSNDITNVNYDDLSVYRYYFEKELTVFTLLGQLCEALFIISIICIVLTVYSSVSLETRGRQKEVAIRKVNGAKKRDIMIMFARPYIKMMSISLSITLIMWIIVLVLITNYEGWNWEGFLAMFGVYLASILVIAIVTGLSIWQKIYKISHVNPSEIIQNS